MIPFADLKRQYKNLKSKIDACIHDSLENTAFIGGQGILEFEKLFSEYIGVEHCIACANGTDSIEILLKAMGIKEGDEVLVPAISWISTSEAVSTIGAAPVFIDIDPNNYTIDVKFIREKITPKTKAIIPVHLYGQPADMKAIMEIANEFNLKVLEDCAQAHGAKIEDKMVGTFGDAASFSFYPGKNLGAYGDAGCMITNDKNIARVARMIANHGQSKKYYHDRVGCNSRLDNIQAAILRIKLRQLDTYIHNRQKAAAFYDTHFESESKLKTPERITDSDHVFHQYTLQLDDSINRDDLISYLKEYGIPAMVYYPVPAHLQKMFSSIDVSKGDLSHTEWLTTRVISLPMHTELTEKQQLFIVNHIKNFLNTNS